MIELDLELNLSFAGTLIGQPHTSSSSVPSSIPGQTPHSSTITYGTAFSGVTNCTNLSSGMGAAAVAGQKGANLAAAALAGVQSQQVGSVAGLQGMSGVVTRPQLGEDLYCR